MKKKIVVAIKYFMRFFIAQSVLIAILLVYK